MLQGRVPEPEVLYYLRGIVRGLVHLHACGIVHDNVRPATVLLSAQKEPVLMDFGQAKAQTPAAHCPPRPPARKAPATMAWSRTDPSLDIRAVARVACALLTGKELVCGAECAVVPGSAAAPEVLQCPEIPDSASDVLATFIKWCGSPNPQAPPTAEEVLRFLEVHVKPRGVCDFLAACLTSSTAEGAGRAGAGR